MILKLAHETQFLRVRGHAYSISMCHFTCIGIYLNWFFFLHENEECLSFIYYNQLVNSLIKDLKLKKGKLGR